MTRLVEKLYAVPSRLVRALAAALFLLVAILTIATAFGQGRETLGAGDSVRITVFQNPDLTTETRLSEAGTISFPLIGEVSLAGLTPEGAAARIAAQLRDGKFVLKPQVSVEVTKLRSRQVSVLGEVARPGRYPLDGARVRLTDVLALAGGITQQGADTVTVVAARGDATNRIEVDVPAMYRAGDFSRDIELHSGDSIYVPRAPVFYIYGEVRRAGVYRLEPGMTVAQALSVGGGLTERGTERGLEIRRRTPDGKAREIEARLTASVEPDDVIYVKESLF